MVKQIGGGIGIGVVSDFFRVGRRHKPRNGCIMGYESQDSSIEFRSLALEMMFDLIHVHRGPSFKDTIADITLDHLQRLNDYRFAHQPNLTVNVVPWSGTDFALMVAL